MQINDFKLGVKPRFIIIWEIKPNFDMNRA